MLSQASITNVNSTAFSFVVGLGATVEAGGVNLRQLRWRYELAGEEDPKGQDTGNHPSPVYTERMIVTGTGQIVGEGANDTARAADYVTRRKALMAAVLVDDGPQTLEFHHGVLAVTFQGDAQVYANVVLLNADPGGDVEDGSHRMSFFNFVWRVDRGAWLTVAGDAVVKI